MFFAASCCRGGEDEDTLDQELEDFYNLDSWCRRQASRSIPDEFVTTMDYVLHVKP